MALRVVASQQNASDDESDDTTSADTTSADTFNGETSIDVCVCVLVECRKDV